MQTSYSQNMEAGFPGLIADVQFQNIVESKSLESATASPGVVVSRGTDKAKQVVKGGAKPLGILIRDLANEADVNGDLIYSAKGSVGVLTAGKIYVPITNTGNPGDVIKYNSTTGAVGVGAPGQGEVALPGCLESVVSTPGGLGIIRVVDPSLSVVATPVLPVVITTQPADETTIDGEGAEFTVVAEGDPTITYQWQESADGISFGNMTGKTSATLSFTAATADNGNSYRCVVTNGYGSKFSDAAELTVTPGT